MATSIDFKLTRRGRTLPVNQGMREWAEQLNRGMAVAGTRMPGAVQDHLQRIVDLLAAKHGNKWPGGTGVDSLSERSGDLLSSLRAGITVRGATFASTQGSLSGIEYISIQEFGGTLRPKSGGYLAIPLPAALNSDGTPVKANPRDWDGTFVQMSKAGNLLIFRRQGTQVVPLYALKTTVEIPARLGARQMAQDQMPYFTSKVLDAVLQELKA